MSSLAKLEIFNFFSRLPEKKINYSCQMVRFFFLFGFTRNNETKCEKFGKILHFNRETF